MTAGDIFSNYNLSVGTGGVSIQPAGSTQVVLTALFSNSTQTRFQFQGNDFSAGTATGDNPGTSPDFAKFTPQLNTKIFINNSHYVGFDSNSGTIKAGYSGIEI